MTTSDLDLQAALPDSWVDSISLLKPWTLARALLNVLVPTRQVVVPGSLPGLELIPSYALRQFHRLPNGNFSNRLSRGYARAFDHSMLGLTHIARRSVAATVQGSARALDLGCGSGALAKAFSEAGIQSVVGVDVNPYMLHHAREMHPGIHFIQANAETLPFEDSSFDAVGVCFLFHELPAAAQDSVVAEIHRVLAAGGKFVLIEPSPYHRHAKALAQTMRSSGILKTLYFWFVSNFVFEPYVDEWHRRPLDTWLKAKGFDVLSDESDVPFRIVAAQKA